MLLAAAAAAATVSVLLYAGTNFIEYEPNPFLYPQLARCRGLQQQRTDYPSAVGCAINQ